jgi:hypothetical protein
MCIGMCIGKAFEKFDTCLQKHQNLLESEEVFSAYYTSKYLIQDTSEAIYTHKKKGFSQEPLIAYIEFWGLMQAIIIQQDSISELYLAITGNNHDTKNLEKWQEIRLLRNACIGHPARKDRPKSSPLTRTFMGRDFGDYSEISYEKWEYPDKTSHPRVKLSELILGYEHEAENELYHICQQLKEVTADNAG